MYETTSVGSQTEYQPMDTSDNTNLRYCSMMAKYISRKEGKDQESIQLNLLALGNV